MRKLQILFLKCPIFSSYAARASICFTGFSAGCLITRSSRGLAPLACSGAPPSTRFTNCPSATVSFPACGRGSGSRRLTYLTTATSAPAGKPQQTFRRLVRHARFSQAADAGADLIGNFRRLLSWPLLRRETPHQDRDGADRLHHARRACAVSRRRATHRDRRARRISRPHLRRGETTPGLSREAAAHVRLIMRGTALDEG